MSKRKKKAKAKKSRPITPVTLVAPCKTRRKCKTLKALALVDTGASMSFISKRAAKKLGLKRSGRRPAIGLGGQSHHNTYPVTMTFPGTGLKDVTIPETYSIKDVANNGPELDVILGIDVMAAGNMSLTFDGPNYALTLKPAVSRAIQEELAKPRRRRR